MLDIIDVVVCDVNALNLSDFFFVCFIKDTTLCAGCDRSAD